MNLRYGTFCSGIEAPGVAWNPLGWSLSFTSEIEPFCCRLLAQRHPKAPNLGDMTRISDEQIRQYPVDLICAGTPCQSFSVAGNRAGLDDPRGQLAFEFLRLVAASRPRWLVWENVPGVLSSNGGKDFGAFLWAVGKIRYGWAYRVLDAQWFGLPQRRKRVFFVGYLGDWRRAAAVLFERNCLSWNPAPRREAGKAVAGSTGSRTSADGGLGTDFECSGGIVNCLSPGAHPGGFNGQDAYTNQLIAVIENGNQGSGGNRGWSDPAEPVQTISRRNYPAIAFNWQGGGVQTNLGYDEESDISGNLQSHQVPAICFDETQITSKTNRSNPQSGDPCHTLAKDALPPSIAGPHGVRRLTPLETERLQGFPDNYTRIDIDGKPAADSSRYRAIGNSMAVPVLKWIGERIQLVDTLPTAYQTSKVQCSATDKRTALGNDERLHVREGRETHAN